MLWLLGAFPGAASTLSQIKVAACPDCPALRISGELHAEGRILQGQEWQGTEK